MEKVLWTAGSAWVEAFPLEKPIYGLDDFVSC